MTSRYIDRRGMTLPELLVVVAIIGLLAVTVLPVLANGRGKAKAREASDLVIAHLSQTMAKAIGSRTGAATWFETAASEAGNDSAVVTLAFGRPRAGVSGTSTVTRTSPSTATISLASVVSAHLPAPIEFAGVPNRFTALPGAGGVFIVSGTAGAGSQNLNRTAANNMVPDSPATAIPYLLHLPPRLRMTASTRRVPGGLCIDLTESTIGVDGFTPSVISLAGARRVSLVFDKTGRPEAVWYSPNHDPLAPAWQFVALDTSTPVALLVGVHANCGNAYVANRTETDPGKNWQDPDARWVVIDPRTSIIKSIEVNAQATSRAESQEFVLRMLRNSAS
jgi:prepilin-type N-terminal cleavage/methylation domain-containing protein